MGIYYVDGVRMSLAYPGWRYEQTKIAKWKLSDPYVADVTIVYVDVGDYICWWSRTMILQSHIFMCKQ